jgi:type VI secretion system protein ImpH
MKTSYHKMDFQELEYSYNNSVFDVHSDFKPETIAYAFIHKGIKAEHIILRSTGTASRSYKKDVNKITFKNTDDIDYVFIDSPKEGIYDSLPESIFHSFSSSQSKDNTLQIIDEIRRHREEETHARNFFLPFEQEFFSIKRELFSFEEHFENHSHGSLLIKIFKPYFSILNELDAEKGYLFIRLIPYIHAIRNDFEKTRDYLEILLDCSVAIKEHIISKEASGNNTHALGSSSLGVDFIIGNEIHDGEFDLMITITSKLTGQVTFEKTDELIHLTNRLCDYFFSAHYGITIRYEHPYVETNSLLDGNNLLGVSLIFS